MSKVIARSLIAAAVLLASLGTAGAQDWPTRPINLVVPAGIGRTVFLKRPGDVPRSLLVDALQILRRHALGHS